MVEFAAQQGLSSGGCRLSNGLADSPGGPPDGLDSVGRLIVWGADELRRLYRGNTIGSFANSASASPS
jgi:hypothetical protein